MRFISLLFVLTLCSCASDYDERDDHERLHTNQLARNINGIIDEFGPPTQIFKMPNGQTIYSWTIETDIPQADKAAAWQHLSCKKIYKTDEDNRVIGFREEGNYCFHHS